MGVNGLHHITCIAGDPQQNLDFYVGVLGLRLVKRSINQDVPDSYHLFFADGAGTPGTDLTFFPWPHLSPAQKGIGQASEVVLAIPSGSIAFWQEHLAGHDIAADELLRFGEPSLAFDDPHGLALVLSETSDVREAVPWADSPIPADRQIKGLHGIRARQRHLMPSASLLSLLGFEEIAEEDGWHRFSTAGGRSGTWLDLREESAAPRGAWGVGGVHHVAWRMPDEAAELKLRERLLAAGRRPSEVIDRFWFRSVYFLEPGGVLFELATDGPGFTVDEAPEHLGESLVLPPWYEPQRAEIEAALPALQVPEVV